MLKQKIILTIFVVQADNIVNKLDQANLSATGGMFPMRWNTKTSAPFDGKSITAAPL